VRLRNADAFRLRFGTARQRQNQHTVADFGFDLFGIDVIGNADGK
jgi:hypothetical protein